MVMMFDPSQIHSQQPDLSLLGNNAPSFRPTIGQNVKSLLGNQDLALALLSNSGYSPQKRSLGEVFGTSALQARQMGQQRQDDAFKRQYMQAQMQSMGQRAQGPSSVQEYQFAKQDGFKGTFEEWTTKAGQTSRPSNVQEWEYFKNLNPDEQKRYLELRRNPNFRVQDVMGAPTVVTGAPGGGFTSTPLSTTAQEISAAARRKEAEAAATAVGTASGGQAAKAPAKASFDAALANMRASVKATPQGMISGPVGTVTAYGDKKLFQSRQQQLSTELRTVFRIAGEGTLSDQEQQQYGLQLPSTDFPPEVNEQIMNDLEQRVKLRQETPMTGAASVAPSAQPKRRKYNPATGKIE